MMRNKQQQRKRRGLRDIRDHFWIGVLAFTLRRLDAKKVTVEYDPPNLLTMVWIYWKDKNGND